MKLYIYIWRYSVDRYIDNIYDILVVIVNNSKLLTTIYDVLYGYSYVLYIAIMYIIYILYTLYTRLCSYRYIEKNT